MEKIILSQLRLKSKWWEKSQNTLLWCLQVVCRAKLVPQPLTVAAAAWTSATVWGCNVEFIKWWNYRFYWSYSLQYLMLPILLLLYSCHFNFDLQIMLWFYSRHFDFYLDLPKNIFSIKTGLSPLPIIWGSCYWKMLFMLYLMIHSYFLFFNDLWDFKRCWLLFQWPLQDILMCCWRFLYHLELIFNTYHCTVILTALSVVIYVFIKFISQNNNQTNRGKNFSEVRFVPTQTEQSKAAQSNKYFSVITY